MLDANEWIDRARAAELAGCSVDTIKRDVRTFELTTRLDRDGKVTVRVGDLIEVGRIDAQVPPTTAADVADAITLRRELEELRVQHAELTGSYRVQAALIDELREHITSLNRFVAVLERAAVPA